MKKYDHKKIEKKWQKFWETKKLFSAKDFDKQKKFFALIEFPYPSGDGLHVGHARSYTALDAVARYKRMQGLNVLYPIGWDAFGLPTENFAIKHKIHPRVAADKNIKNFKRQLKALGISFDWDREVDTTDPKYYKWTQWIFLQLYKAGLAYRDEIAINWCPSCKIGLANEEVVNGRHERCGTLVEKKLLKQWLVKITKYADRLIKDLDEVDFSDRVKNQQINWIGRSEGAKIKFPLKGIAGQDDGKHAVEVFTTRPDTIFGSTFIVVSPELAEKWLSVGWQAKDEVKNYIKKALAKAELERQEGSKDKTGIDTGIKAVNTATKEEIPVWVADYVLGGVGTGAIMAVPAHDERDFEFAKKFVLPIKQVIAPETGIKRDDEVVVKGGCTVVFDPTSQKYAVAKWDKGWYGLFSGGLEKDESEKEGILRELTEESGLYDFDKIEKIAVAYPHYHNSAKNKNRYGYAACYLVILRSNKQRETQKQPHENFHLEWHSANEILRNWQQYNHQKDVDHWIWFLNKAVSRAFELGKDYTSKESVFKDRAYSGHGVLINSGEFTDMTSEKAIPKIIKEYGETAVTYKFRDWVFSRQHYWGEPIPIIYCEKCGEVPVPEEDLPVELPKVKNYEPTVTGESPLAAIKKFVETKCPKCDGPARRETDTMPNWAGSNWYFLRYLDPHNSKTFADRTNIDYWMPVDLYNGGMEHTTLHLLYSRFMYKFLFDQGLVPAKEPYAKRTSHGVILAEDGRKMSKSFGNVINPDDIVSEYGADTLRLYEMFLAPFDQMVPWDSRGVIGVKRFLDRLYKFYQRKFSDSAGEEELKLINRLIVKVTSDIDEMKFNTIVSSFMETLNSLEKMEKVSQQTALSLTVLLSPFAPHLAEEVWEMLGQKDELQSHEWPKAEKKYLVDDTMKIAVQVNGRVRNTLVLPVDLSENEVFDQALNSAKVDAHIAGKEIVKRIYVKGKIVNFVVK